MSRTSYVWREGELYERGTEPPLPRGPRSSLPAPSIRPDGMDAIQSMANGEMYDSRSAYYRSVKQAGCEIVGDESKPFENHAAHRAVDAGPVAPDIKRAMQELGMP